jgi:hypothetical protein
MNAKAPGKAAGKCDDDSAATMFGNSVLDIGNYFNGVLMLDFSMNQARAELERAGRYRLCFSWIHEAA